MKASLTGILLFALASGPALSGAEAPVTAVKARRLPGDPLQDVGVLARIDFVMKGGEVARPVAAGGR